MKKALFLVKYDILWVGGLYYKYNLVRALRMVNKKIPIIVYTEEERIPQIEELFKALDVQVEAYNKALPTGLFKVEKFFQRKLKGSLVGMFDKNLISGNTLFDYFKFGKLGAVPRRKRLYWVPDIQIMFHPEFYDDVEKNRRHSFYAEILAEAEQVVFSSKAALQTFRDFFPAFDASGIQPIVLQFAVSHPDTAHIQVDEVLKKYKLEVGNYFIVCNQLMIHKNHFAVIEALRICKERGNTAIKVVFTGKAVDPRDPDFFNRVVERIQTYGLQDQIIITDLISREEQLVMIKHATAVVQPSKFEGWNSTVEDAKLIGKRIIVSSIDVHKEQMEGYEADFFEPDDHVKLADLLSRNYTEIPVPDYHYHEKQLEMGRILESIFLD